MWMRKKKKAKDRPTAREKERHRQREKERHRQREKGRNRQREKEERGDWEGERGGEGRAGVEDTRERERSKKHEGHALTRKRGKVGARTKENTKRC